MILRILMSFVYFLLPSVSLGLFIFPLFFLFISCILYVFDMNFFLECRDYEYFIPVLLSKFMFSTISFKF